MTSCTVLFRECGIGSCVLSLSKYVTSRADSHLVVRSRRNSIQGPEALIDYNPMPGKEDGLGICLNAAPAERCEALEGTWLQEFKSSGFESVSRSYSWVAGLSLLQTLRCVVPSRSHFSQLTSFPCRSLATPAAQKCEQETIHLLQKWTCVPQEVSVIILGVAISMAIV